MTNRKRNITIRADRLSWIMSHRPVPSDIWSKYCDYQFEPDKQDQFVEDHFPNERITRKELSELTGLSEKTIQNARSTGYISPESLEMICESLDTSKNYLLGIDDETWADIAYGSSGMFLNGVLKKDFKLSKARKDFGDYMDDAYDIRSSLKIQNRLDKDNVYIPPYKEGYVESLYSVSFMKDFIKNFMNSEYYCRPSNYIDINDFSTYGVNNHQRKPYKFEELKPQLQDYISYFFINDVCNSINKFMDKLMEMEGKPIHKNGDDAMDFAKSIKKEKSLNTNKTSMEGQDNGKGKE